MVREFPSSKSRPKPQYALVIIRVLHELHGVEWEERVTHVVIGVHYKSSLYMRERGLQEQREKEKGNRQNPSLFPSSSYRGIPWTFLQLTSILSLLFSLFLHKHTHTLTIVCCSFVHYRPSSILNSKNKKVLIEFHSLLASINTHDLNGNHFVFFCITVQRQEQKY